MHGVGVFDYATIPGVLKTQVYMCPFAPCTVDMMETGQCLTFIQAVAIQVRPGHPNAHTMIWKNNALRIDGVDRKAESNITFGTELAVAATGSVSATAELPRIDHDTLADCHVLDPTAPMAIRMADRVWQNCTTNEWTLTTPDLIIDVGVIGPFEEGYLREEVSDRTFNLDISRVKNKSAVQGIINGDINGLFVQDAKYNYAPNPNGIPGALIPVPQPHGRVLEVTAPNVDPKDVIFSRTAMDDMDAACGPQKSLSAVQMTMAGDEQTRRWKQRQPLTKQDDQDEGKAKYRK